MTATPEAERSAQADGHLRRELLLAGCSHERIEREAGKALAMLIEQLSDGDVQMLADVKLAGLRGLNYLSRLRRLLNLLWIYCD